MKPTEVKRSGVYTGTYKVTVNLPYQSGRSSVTVDVLYLVQFDNTGSLTLHKCEASGGKMMFYAVPEANYQYVDIDTRIKWGKG